MKHLDDTVPSEYFEDLPKRVLAQLEKEPMQTDSSSDSPSNSDAHLSSPSLSGSLAASSDDSGLHDIRSLARSTKQRISRKITSQPFEEDVLASSSAGWKAVALPEPAKMVSLPELADLPSKAEIKAREKAAKEAAKAEKAAARTSAAAIETKPAPVVAAAAPVAAAAVDMPAPAKAPVVTPITAAKPRPTPAARSNMGRNLAIAGMGLAAAAAVVFVVTNKKSTSSDDASKAPAAASKDEKLAGSPTATGNVAPAKPVVTPLDPPPAAPQQIAQQEEAPTPPPPPVETAKEPASAKPGKGDSKKAGPDHSVKIDNDTAKGAGGKGKTDEKKLEVKPDANAPKGDGSKDPSLDDLLKDAGGGEKKDLKPKLDKKSLSTSDITSGMGAVGGAAKACFKGTQGQASVRLTVTPDGHVSKVSVNGVFAGKPEGACVEAAVRSASFPPWDGGPQSFNFSYLLSE